MYKCEKCNKEFEKRKSYIAHCKVHSTKEKEYYKCEKCNKEFMYQKSFENHKCKNKLSGCIYCGKEFQGRSLSAHISSCKLNPNYKSRCKNIGKGLIGKKLTDEHKRNVSKSRLKYLIANPDKVPYLLNHSSKESYPEKIFRKALEDSNILGWVQRFQNSIYQYDFAFPELKIDVEIDGGTHLTEKVKKIDERRDKFSQENGWKVIRFTAKEVKENVINCINKLKEII